MFTSAWKSFLLTGIVKDKKVYQLVVDDLIEAVEFLVIKSVYLIQFDIFETIDH